MQPPSSNTQPRAYSAAHFGLELDGNHKTVGLFRSIEGGGVSAEVMSYQHGANYDVWRQLGKPKFEDFKIQVGMAMSKPFYDWMEDFFAGRPTRKNGAIVAADFYYAERARREFSEALISAIDFPKLDATDKNAAYMTVTVSPEKMVFTPGKGQKLELSVDDTAAKLWTCCNFRLAMDGLDASLKRVTKIDGFSIKQKIIEYHHGGRREPVKVPSRVEWPNLVFYVPEVDAGPIIDEFMKHAADGNPQGAADQRNGHIETFDHSGKALFNVILHGIQLKSASPDKSDANSEEIKQVKFEVSIEKMEFEYLRLEME
ncbi:MAG: phage tail protein [Deltaproteobacteria bacterium]|nr:phage tail protein [Deltaproteobacteria bacterium]